MKALILVMTLGQDDVASLLKELENDNIEERTRAEQRLIALGPANKDVLRTALEKARDREVAERLKQILSRISRVRIVLRQGTAYGVRISPDGKWIASWGRNEAILSELEKPGTFHEFVGQELFAFDPAGGRFATAGDEGVALWDLRTLTVLQGFKTGGRGVEALEFDATGKRLLTAGRESPVQVWDAATGKELKQLDHKAVKRALWLSKPDRIITAGDGDLKIWNGTDYAELRKIQAHKGEIWGISAADGKLASVGFFDKRIRVHDLETGRLVAESDGHRSNATTVAFRPDGLVLASGGYDDRILLWDAKTGAQKAEFHTGDALYGLCFASKGLASAGSSGLELRDVESGMPTRMFQRHSSDATEFVSFSADETQVIATGEGENGRPQLHVFEAATGKQVRVIKEESSVNCGSVRVAGDLLAGIDNNGRVQVWDLRKGGRIAAAAKVNATQPNHHATGFSSDGKSLLTYSKYDGKLRTFALESFQETGQVSVPLQKEGFERNFILLPGRKALGYFQSDEFVLRDAGSAKEVQRLKGISSPGRHDNDVMAFDAAERWLVVLGADQGTYCADLQSGKVHALPEAAIERSCVAISPDGHWMAVGDEKGKVTFLEAATRKPLVEYQDHDSEVTRIRFSPKGYYVATFSVRGGIYLRETQWLGR